jgi:hypothetical protein
MVCSCWCGGQVQSWMRPDECVAAAGHMHVCFLQALQLPVLGACPILSRSLLLLLLLLRVPL